MFEEAKRVTVKVLYTAQPTALMPGVICRQMAVIEIQLDPFTTPEFTKEDFECDRDGVRKLTLLGQDKVAHFWGQVVQEEKRRRPQILGGGVIAGWILESVEAVVEGGPRLNELQRRRLG